MATSLDDIYFSTETTGLDKRKIGVPTDPFGSQYALGMYAEDVTTPKGYEVPDIEEKEQEIDVPGGAAALDTDIEEAAMLFTDEEKEKERKRLSRFVDPLGIQMQQLGRFSEIPTKIKSDLATTRGIGISRAPPASLAGQGAAELGELEEAGLGEVPLSGDFYAPETGLGTLLEKGGEYAWEEVGKPVWEEVGKPVWEEAKDVYYDYFKDPVRTYTGTGYGSPSAMGQPTWRTDAVAGAGRGIKAIREGWGGTGYGKLAPPEAGGYFGSIGEIASTLGSIFSIYRGVESGTGEGKFDAAMAGAALINPALAIPVAIISGLKALFGMRRRGRPKFPFGGTEFKTEGNKLKYKHPYGYNGFNGGVARAGAASVSDYVNTFVDHFSDVATGQGLQFSSSAWKNAVKKDPRMLRYDTMNDSGYADPSVLIRKILEAPGVVSGTPTVGGTPITNQEQYQQAVTNFNQWYSKTAIDRGGLVNAEWLNTKEEPNVFYEGWAGQYGEIPDQIKFSSRRETGRTGPGGNVPGRPIYEYYNQYETPVESPYDVLYYNMMGKFNRGEGGMGY